MPAKAPHYRLMGGWARDADPATAQQALLRLTQPQQAPLRLMQPQQALLRLTQPQQAPLRLTQPHGAKRTGHAEDTQ